MRRIILAVVLFLVAVLYMTVATAATIVTTRAGKGSPLTWTELDTNFTALRDKLDGSVASINGAIASLQAGQQAGTIGYLTKADMDADLAHPAGTIAFVTNDPVDTKNVPWIKIGAAGSGSWQQSALSPALPYADSRKIPSLADWIASVGVAQSTLYVSTSMPISSNLTIPENIRVVFLRGGSINIPEGITLTVNGYWDANNHQVIVGLGRVKYRLASTPFIRPEWRGAVADKSTDCYAAFQATIDDAVASAGTPSQLNGLTYLPPIRLMSGHYKISSGLVIPECIGFSLEGGGPGMGYGTIIQWSGTDQPAAYMIDARSVLGLTLKNITLIGQSDISNVASSCAGNGIITGRTATYYNSQNEWENVSVVRFPGVGITFGRYSGYSGGVYPDDTGQTDNSIFTNTYVHDCRIGIVINSPNFLQCHFDRLMVNSYGGNPVDGNGDPVESVYAAPVKFRTKNAVRILYGSLVGSSIHLSAPFRDADPESQYAIYVLDGSFNIESGYSEAKYLVYVANGANDAGGQGTKAVNSINNFDSYPGDEGGPDTAGKYLIYYDQQLVPLTLSATDDVWVMESSRSAGVKAVGCRSQKPAIAMTDGTYYTRNPKSSEIACSIVTYDSGTRYSGYTRFGRSAGVFSDNSSEITLLTDMVPKRIAGDVLAYAFQSSATNTSHGLISNTDGLHLVRPTGLVNGQLLSMTSLLAHGNAVSIRFGAGAPTHSANNGSLYLRIDGGATTTIYVRVLGSWQAK